MLSGEFLYRTHFAVQGIEIKQTIKKLKENRVSCRAVCYPVLILDLLGFAGEEPEDINV